jgi:DUF218 domain
MPGMPVSQIFVANVTGAERMAIELVRNTLVAYPNTNVSTRDVDGWPELRRFIATETARFGARTPDGARDVLVAGDPDRSRLTVTMPSGRRVELVLGTPTGEVVVVPGTARTVHGTHRLTAESFGRLRRAERIASRRPVRALILSGWNGRDGHGSSEAAQLLDAWRGPEVPVVLDEAARTTAENALWSAALAAALGDVPRLRMITAWVSAPRLWLATRAALRGTGIRLRLSVVWGRAQAASWRPATAGLVHLRRHLRIGRALLTRGPDDPGARL